MTNSKIIASDIMDSSPPYCQVDDSIEEVARRFVEEDVSGMLVVDEDRCLVGIITETDLIDQQKNLHVPTAITLFDMVIPVGESQFEEEINHLQAMTVTDLARTDVVTINAETDLNEIASIMGDKNVHHLPVLDGDDIIGLIGKHDVIRALVSSR